MLLSVYGSRVQCTRPTVKLLITVGPFPSFYLLTYVHHVNIITLSCLVSEEEILSAIPFALRGQDSDCEGVEQHFATGRGGYATKWWSWVSPTFTCVIYFCRRRLSPTSSRANVGLSQISLPLAWKPKGEYILGKHQKAEISTCVHFKFWYLSLLFSSKKPSFQRIRCAAALRGLLLFDLCCTRRFIAPCRVPSRRWTQLTNIQFRAHVREKEEPIHDQLNLGRMEFEEWQVFRDQDVLHVLGYPEQDQSHWHQDYLPCR